MDKTLIQVSKETSDKLKKLRITNRESYDEIIKRLVFNKNAKN